MYAVILAGGGGTRLWPLSSPERPKPFLPLLGDRSLLQLTADRLAGLVGPRSTFVVTDRRYATIVAEQLPATTVLSEPEGRNTAAAIALAAVAIERPADEVMLVLPADQSVAEDRLDAFQDVLRNAERELALGAFGLRGPLVTLGVQVTRPATEYGYLIPDPDQRQRLRIDAHRLRAFEEKPGQAHAEQLCRQPGVAWNAGMFMWRRSAIEEALRRFAPDVLEPVLAGFRAGTLEAAYPGIRSVSIDYAVMEPAAAAGRVVMGSMDVGWNDLGSWASLLGALGLPGIEATIVKPGETLEPGADDLLVWRAQGGRLTSNRGSDATMTGSSRPVAVLRGVSGSTVPIDRLLERCSSPEAHS